MIISWIQKDQFEDNLLDENLIQGIDMGFTSPAKSGALKKEKKPSI